MLPKMFFYWMLAFLLIFYISQDHSCDGQQVACYPTSIKSKMIGNLDDSAQLIAAVQDMLRTDHSSFICPTFPVDCSELMKCGFNKSGVYQVWPRSRVLSDVKQINVFCDMITDGGGWTVIQRRGDYGRAKDYFFQDWKHYKEGFGILTQDFWLGNDKIFALTNQQKSSIRFDLQDSEGESRFAFYDYFWTDDEDHQYKLHVEGYSGTAGDSLMERHNGMNFSTKDRDNDIVNEDCAALYKGGWWYDGCHASNLNGLYLGGKHESYADGIEWNSWKGLHYSLTNTEMKIRPTDYLPSTGKNPTAVVPMR